MPGSGTTHFLIDAWDNILGGLEDNRAAVNIISVDYEKVFNRMGHAACLMALARKGASQFTVDMIFSFLSNRQMGVKIGKTISKGRHVTGGSPQGSLLGYILFSITTDDLARVDGPEQISSSGGETRR